MESIYSPMTKYGHVTIKLETDYSFSFWLHCRGLLFRVYSFHFCLVILIYRLVESKKWWHAVVEAAIVYVVTYYVFVELFNVKLPKPFYAWKHRMIKVAECLIQALYKSIRLGFSTRPELMFSLKIS